jgi:acyl-coenzyme A synthetase/AMP-(fatty) acid ligase
VDSETSFNLSTLFNAIAQAIPDQTFLIAHVWHPSTAASAGAVAYESIVDTARPPSPMPDPTGDDLYILYTGGTTGMPKGVLWRQHDRNISTAL